MSASSNSGKKPAAGGGRGGPTIRTLSDLNRGPAGFPGAGGGGGSSDDDEPQEYYTGGEKSGMLVQDPTRRNDVDAIFEQARQAGAIHGMPPFLGDESSSSRSFSGTGRLLTGETVPSAAPQELAPVRICHNIHLWNNGFSVDDGPLRYYDDPENAEFLESLKMSKCPRELVPTDGEHVDVSVIKRMEDYREPVRPRSAFQGVGRTLGGGPSPDESAPPAPASAAPAASRSVGIVVDDSQPFTSVQLRLADGTRMVARFNMHHTVGNIRSFIDASRPGAARPYQLQTGFPPKQLADPTQTVEQAGLANSVIMQKM
ncbi:plant UBX domain-containing protein 4-like isoform X2 [Miscanthus floridulus]|uniref:plant UBX domain-containing protein 4-like isoform X2 n=1 Tax=Miscanthus floridulus TaxID=154761 RepID=UPI00345B42A8